MSKIVVLDGRTLNPGDLSWTGLESLGSYTVYESTPAEDIVARVGDAEIIYTNKTVLDKDTLAALPSVKFVGCLSTGFNVVDIAAAKALGMVVCNVPSYGSKAVAQFVFAHLLEISNQVQNHVDAVRAGRWTASETFCFWDNEPFELSGKTLGIWGYGSIGSEVARIAQAFDMRVLAYARSPKQSPFAEFVSLDELLSQSDIISLHMPYFPETDGILNRETIAKMKDGVIVINTSRGQLANEKDVRAALDAQKISWYAADVVREEPIRADNPLLGAYHAQVTPHIAWAPREARKRLLDVAIDNARQYVLGHPVNVVNP